MFLYCYYFPYIMYGVYHLRRNIYRGDAENMTAWCRGVRGSKRVKFCVMFFINHPHADLKGIPINGFNRWWKAWNENSSGSTRFTLLLLHIRNTSKSVLNIWNSLFVSRHTSRCIKSKSVHDVTAASFEQI